MSGLGGKSLKLKIFRTGGCIGINRGQNIERETRGEMERDRS